ncbi:MAG: peptidoglycan-binding protein [Clostridia bacterium]|nr:peptidoglycan-binding protein [Clostridia bacterium]
MYSTSKKSVILLSLCLVLLIAASSAFAASYSNVYGLTTTRIRVRETASTSGVLFDNIEQGRIVYVTESKDSGGTTFLHVKYRTLEGKTETGWIAQSSGGSTFVTILTDEQAKADYDVSSGDLPKTAAGTKSSAERESLRAQNTLDTIADNSAPAAASETAAPVLNASAATISDVQMKLKAIGIYAGDVTGRAGEKTIAAIKAFQKKIGIDQTGQLTNTTLKRLNEAYEAQLAANPSAAAADSDDNQNLANTGVSARTMEQVQTMLKTLDFYSGEITGNAGEKTIAAIKAFQTQYGLTADGIVGNTTLKKLTEVYNAFQASDASIATAPTAAPASETTQSASSGTIMQVQEKLKALGFYNGEVTGNAGSKTTAAIKAFQQKYGLTADGIAGSATLAKLNEVYNSQGKTSETSAPSATSAPANSASSSTIRQVQEKLKALGFYNGEVTGNAGSKTTAAIKAFQKKYGLTADGIVGSATLNKLNEVYNAAGSSASDTSAEPVSTSSSNSSVSSSTIRQVQEKLKALGFYSGEVTGNAGSKTTAAIKAFQKKYGLTTDGIIGNATLTKLDEVYNAGSSSSTSATPAPASSSVSSSTIRQAQEKLKALGLYSGEVTGNAGAKTTAAIKAFQKKYGLSADGVLGNATLSKLDEVYNNLKKKSSTSTTPAPKSNVSAATVKTVQTKLKELGFYSGDITGSIGNKTTAAVKAFQKKYGLTVDGILGTNTIAKINSVYKASTTSSSSSSSSTSTRKIYSLDWFKAKNNHLFGQLGLSKGRTVRLTDLNSGITLTVSIQSASNHLDVEPLTSADTEKFLKIYHVTSASKITFLRRPGVVTTETGYRIVCSFYGQPHGSQLIHTNHFDGQFCIHFLNSKTHGSNVVDGDHQACIRTATAHYGSSNVKIIRTSDDL